MEGRCVLCNSGDRDMRHDHLRQCSKMAQDILSPSVFKPRLASWEMDRLQLGENDICSNRTNCRKRMQSAREKRKDLENVQLS